MRGTKQTCNHVTGSLYIMKYDNLKGLYNPASIELPCQWNRVNPREIKAKESSDLVVRQVGCSKDNDVDIQIQNLTDLIPEFSAIES